VMKVVLIRVIIEKNN